MGLGFKIDSSLTILRPNTSALLALNIAPIIPPKVNREPNTENCEIYSDYNVN